MGKTKSLAIDTILELALASGYDEDELLDIFWGYCDECTEDGVGIDMEQFAAITMEHDW